MHTQDSRLTRLLELADRAHVASYHLRIRLWNHIQEVALEVGDETVFDLAEEKLRIYKQICNYQE